MESKTRLLSYLRLINWICLHFAVDIHSGVQISTLRFEQQYIIHWVLIGTHLYNEYEFLFDL